MTTYTSQTQTTVCKLCNAQTQLVVIHPGIVPRSVVTSLVLRCSALDRCATQELLRLTLKSKCVCCTYGNKFTTERLYSLSDQEINIWIFNKRWGVENVGIMLIAIKGIRLCRLSSVIQRPQYQVFQQNVE
jgi:hypothetical protein